MLWDPCFSSRVMHKEPSCAMYKGLPTFRAGGVMSRADYLRPDGGSNHKTALTPSYFSSNHFSSSLAGMDDPMLKRTRVAVKIMEGKDLLVSDLPTGTSDPVALSWVASCEEGDIDFQNDKRVQCTDVRKHTVDPVWDAEFIFPLEIQSVEDVMSGRANIVVRDHDDADGDVHYLDLGRVTVSLETVLTEGNIMAHTQLVQLPARWYSLQPCRGMKKSRGVLKIAIGFFLGPDSILLHGESGETVYQDANTAARFEHLIKSIRRDRGSDGSERPHSMSPSRRSPTARSLTARGGTTFQRSKSAPEPTTLTSPTRGRRGPFELKPLQAQFPSKGIQVPAVAQSGLNNLEATGGSSDGASGMVAGEHRPRWRDTYGSPERPPQNTTASFHPRADRADVEKEKQRLQKDKPVVKHIINSPVIPQHVRSSSKLSRLVAKAARRDSRGASPGASSSWDEEEGATLRAHRWHRRLLESMQRIESRSTEAMAYGELRAMIREASAVQVGQVVTAARGVGSACSLAARRCTLRLLGWLCWEQPIGASKICGGIVSYALDRIRDKDSASLRDDLAVCVGAVMLSALQNSSANACMVQTRRFLELVKEQTISVRESAGSCCVAAVLPPSPFIPIEIKTGLRNIDEVRSTIGMAAGLANITSTVPKEAALLPGGLAVIEVRDASAAADFFDRLKFVVENLPPTWSVCPFPEDVCTEIRLAEETHYARLIVNSEEILAYLLEALDSNRSEGTRAQLFNAIGAMARSCSTHENQLETSNFFSTAATLSGLSATLTKGLPAIVGAILVVLECPIRRSYTWKERKATLELVVSLTTLIEFRGPEGPLGEHRAKLIIGSIRGKHDSAAAVREVASQALEALEAVEAEIGQAENGGRATANFGITSNGEGFDKISIIRAGEVKRSKKLAIKRKNLEGVMEKTMRANKKSVQAIEHDEKHNQDGQEWGRGAHQHRQAKEKTESPQEEPTESPTPSVSSSEKKFQSSRGGQKLQQSLTRRVDSTAPSPTEEFGSRNENTSEPVRLKSKPLEPRSIQESGTESGLSDTNLAPRLLETRRSTEKETPPPVDAAEVDNIEDDPPLQRKIKSANTKHASAPANMAALELQPPKTAMPLASGSVQVALQPVTLHAVETPIQVRPSTEVDSIPSSLPPPTHAGAQVDTLCLLRHLNVKTDDIASLLSNLDRRLLDMEKTFVEHPHKADVLARLPSRKLKRSRSARMPETENILKAGGKPKLKPKAESVRATASRIVAMTNDSSAHRLRHLRRDIGLLVQSGDIDGAFRLALRSGTERDVLRLMGSAGGPDLCRRRLGMGVRDRLFAFIARTISGGKYAEHALPWVFEVVRAGEARALPLAVRMQLAGALHGLATNPTDQGVMAAKLGPYLSLTCMGRSSLSDATEGGGIFSSMEVVGCGS